MINAEQVLPSHPVEIPISGNNGNNSSMTGAAASALEEKEQEQQSVVAVSNSDVIVLNPPRAGKKLCVLDIDQTIYDCRSRQLGEKDIDLLKRPYLDRFLARIYPYFDIGIWSSTNSTAIEAKLKYLRLLENPHYKITFIANRRAMVVDPTQSTRVKALELFWKLFPEYNETNTIHIDDRPKNFVYNPENGVIVSSYDDCNQEDIELEKLEYYLLKVVAPLNDVRELDLKNWDEEVPI
ncbi:hypothetical protein ABK040_003313 [Willaertia magna]